MEAVVRTLRMGAQTRACNRALVQAKPTMLEKCVYSKSLLPSHVYGPLLEREVLQSIGATPTNQGKGDAAIGDLVLEVKVSLSDHTGKLNLVQLRPFEAIDYYVLLTWDMASPSPTGTVHTFLLSGASMNNLIVRYGGYAHGGIASLGPITSEGLAEDKREYALRPCTSSSPSSKARRLWGELRCYEKGLAHISAELHATTRAPDPPPP